MTPHTLGQQLLDNFVAPLFCFNPLFLQHIVLYKSNPRTYFLIAQSEMEAVFWKKFKIVYRCIVSYPSSLYLLYQKPTPG